MHYDERRSEQIIGGVVPIACPGAGLSDTLQVTVGNESLLINRGTGDD
ncbi:hypothetical protein [Stenotrophomonas daejeonensis]|nr:hypothetical protein [Stenotrophomonas daejeonensis]